MAHYGFSQFRDEQSRFFREMMAKIKPKFIFTTDINGDDLYEIYLNIGREAGLNNRFRTNEELECSNCKSFFRKVANCVFVTDKGKRISLWDFESADPRWDRVRHALSDAVHAANIVSVFVSKEPSVSCEKNRELIETDVVLSDELKEKISGEFNSKTSVISWSHFFMKFPTDWTGPNWLSIRGEMNDNHNVLYRTMTEWNPAAITTVLDLIKQNNLYRGPEHKSEILKIQNMMNEYSRLSVQERDDIVWYWATNLSSAFCRFKNTLIGTLITGLSVKTETGAFDQIGLNLLEQELHKYEAAAAPENYKRPKALFTEAMLQAAIKKLEEDGLLDSIPRRFASMTDIDPTQILFADSDIKKKFWGIGETAGMFEALSHMTVAKPMEKDTKNAMPMSMSDFLKNLLPKAKKIDLYYAPSLMRNRMALITAKNPDSPSMFKWPNQVSWMYSGSITSSSLKENVKAAGGRVEGDLRFSIQWNDIAGEWDKNDLDNHCIFTPYSREFYEKYYENKKNSRDRTLKNWILNKIDHYCKSVRIYYADMNAIPGGCLDIDIRNPVKDNPAVENIIFANHHGMVPGIYKFGVLCFAGRGGRSGVRAELEADGEVYNYDYKMVFSEDQFVDFVTVEFDGENFKVIKHHQPSTLGAANEVWGLKTNSYIPVNLIANSPNYWGNSSIGAKHVFFILDGMKSDETLNGFANEFISDDITQKHKRVLEALATQAAVIPGDEEQLAGIGFNTSQAGQSVILRVTTDTGVKVVKVTI